MDLKRGITFPLQDGQWLSKVAVGTIVSLVPFLNFAAVGYTMDTIRNVYHGHDTPLPEWDRFGSYFVRGLVAVLIQVLWALPLIVLLCPLFLVMLAAGDPAAGEASGIAAGLLACLFGLYTLAAIVVVPLSVIAQSRYAVSDNVAEAMPGPVLREIRQGIRPWGIVVLALLAFGVVAGVVAACTFGLGGLLLIPLAFYMQLVVAHWYAQAHREATGQQMVPGMV